jgi:hypothetical protein
LRHVQENDSLSDTYSFYYFIPDVITEPLPAAEIAELKISILESKLADTQTYKLQTYPNAIIGSSLVDWLVKTKNANDRLTAVGVGRQLRAVGLRSCAGSSPFDDTHNLYTFDEEKIPLVVEETKRCPHDASLPSSPTTASHAHRRFGSHPPTPIITSNASNHQPLPSPHGNGLPGVSVCPYPHHMNSSSSGHHHHGAAPNRRASGHAHTPVSSATTSSTTTGTPTTPSVALPQSLGAAHASHHGFKDSVTSLTPPTPATPAAHSTVQLHTDT